MIKFVLPVLVACTVFACDPSASDPPTSFRSKTAQAWGPCKGGPGGACESELFCSSDATHSICLPGCGADGCPAIPSALCGGEAPTCAADGRCAFECADDADCLDGTECSAFGVCAWPK